jgi:tyrosine-protein kinase Etk/Wzc
MAPTNLKSNSLEGIVPRQPEPVSGEPLRLGPLDLLFVLAERKWFILTMSLAGGLAMALIAFNIPPMYTATATIMSPQQQQSTAAALLGQLGPIAAATGANLGIKVPADLYVGILGSRSIADELIRGFDLRQLYRTKTSDDTRRVLKSRSSVTAGLKDQLIRIAVDDHDPKRAAAIANAYVDQLYKLTNRLALTESAQRRLFFEEQMATQRRALADSEIALKTTQERTGVLQVSSQVESIIFSTAQLRAQIATREVAISALETGATAGNPEVVKQETELAAMREQLKQLESKGGASTRPGDTMIPTADVPKAGLEYVRALRDLKYNETLFDMLAKQYEAARIDEAKDAPVIQVIDFAVPPDRKTWPPRALLVLAGALGCAVLACVIVFARFRDPEGIEKLHLLTRMLMGLPRKSRG